MTSSEVIQGLLEAGAAMKLAYAKARAKNGGELTWEAFEDSPAFRDAESSVVLFLDRLSASDIRKALATVRERQEAFLDGKKPSELSPAGILELGELADVESVLVRKELTHIQANWRWFVLDALPALVRGAKDML